MREILFRGKVKGVDNTDKWVKGGFHIWEKRMPAPMGNDKLQENEISYVITINSFADWNMPRTMQAVEVMPETVGQYTGLKDANGTKIFEGDIVTGLFDFEFSINAVVEFRDGAFGLLANQHNVEHFHPFTSLCNIEYEVIGNIHDNPELLKGVKNERL